MLKIKNDFRSQIWNVSANNYGITQKTYIPAWLSCANSLSTGVSG